MVSRIPVGDYMRPEKFAPTSHWFRDIVERNQALREIAITDVEFIAEDYQKLARLGQGSFGVVYKARHTETGDVVAVKSMPMGADGVPKTTIREVCTLKQLDHPNVVKLKEVKSGRDDVAIVFEYMSMDLKGYLQKLPGKVELERKTLKSYIFQILQGTLYCHKRGFVHRDLKPANLLVDCHGTIKVADFGLARQTGIPIRVFSRDILTRYYRAPEILMNAGAYTMAIDMWSIGCIFAELYTKTPLFPGDSEIDMMFKIFSTLGTPTDEIWPGFTSLPRYSVSFPNWTKCLLTEKLGDKMPADAINLLKAMLQYTTQRRISARKACKDVFFDDFDRSTLPGRLEE